MCRIPQTYWVREAIPPILNNRETTWQASPVKLLDLRNWKRWAQYQLMKIVKWRCQSQIKLKKSDGQDKIELLNQLKGWSISKSKRRPGNIGLWLLSVLLQTKMTACNRKPQIYLSLQSTFWKHHAFTPSNPKESHKQAMFHIAWYIMHAK